MCLILAALMAISSIGSIISGIATGQWAQVGGSLAVLLVIWFVMAGAANQRAD